MVIDLTRQGSPGDGTTYEAWLDPTAVVVAPSLGTLADVSTSGTNVTIQIALDPNATDGTVTLDGVVVGQTYACSSESCDVHRVFDVTIANGVPEITMLQRLERPLEYRPPLKLALVESRGTEATIAVTGAPAGADICFDVTDGVVSQNGAAATWRLPERPGLYQIEVVVQRDDIVATEALALEVRGATPNERS